jgi:hypothetical protein
MSITHYEPLPPPSPTANRSPPKLTPAQEELYKQVFEHFNRTDYALPKEEKAELSEEEKFWLVRIMSVLYSC